MSLSSISETDVNVLSQLRLTMLMPASGSFGGSKATCKSAHVRGMDSGACWVPLTLAWRVGTFFSSHTTINWPVG